MRLVAVEPRPAAVPGQRRAGAARWQEHAAFFAFAGVLRDRQVARGASGGSGPVRPSPPQLAAGAGSSPRARRADDVYSSERYTTARLEARGGARAGRGGARRGVCAAATAISAVGGRRCGRRRRALTAAICRRVQTARSRARRLVSSLSPLGTFRSRTGRSGAASLQSGTWQGATARRPTVVGRVSGGGAAARSSRTPRPRQPPPRATPPRTTSAADHCCRAPAGGARARYDRRGTLRAIMCANALARRRVGVRGAACEDRPSCARTRSSRAG